MEIKMVIEDNIQKLTRNGDPTERKLHGLSLEKGACSFPVNPPNCKRRKVFAVRNFPPGCGPNALRNNTSSTDAAGCFGNGTTPLCGLKSEAVLETDSMKVSAPEFNSSKVSQSSVGAEAVKSLIKLESTVLSNCMDKPESVKVEPMGVELLSALDNAGLIDSSSASEHETFESSKDSCKADIAYSVDDDMVKSSSLKLKLSPIKPAAYARVLEKTRIKNYPPKRRIFAVRQFPLFCGRDAPYLSDEDYLKALASKSLGQEDFGGKGKLLKENLVVSNYSWDKVKAECEAEGDVNKEAVKLGKEFLFHNTQHKRLKIKFPSLPGSKHQFQREEVGSELAERREKPNLSGSMNQFQREVGSEHAERMAKSILPGSKAQFQREVVGYEHAEMMARPNLAIGMQGSKGKQPELSGYRKSKSIFRDKKTFRQHLAGEPIKKKPPPTRTVYHGSSSGKGNDQKSIVTRNNVMATLHLFQALCRRLMQEDDAKTKEAKKAAGKRIDLRAADIFKKRNLYVKGPVFVGPIPGIEVGDEFQYRVELAIVGVHRPYQSGIDYTNQHGRDICLSIVASGGYDDDMDSSDVLTYTGSGGNVIKIKDGGKQPEDQKLERGNLALKNSISAKNPVRVVRGYDMKDERGKIVKTYTYDGLYMVKNYWQEPGPHGKQVFKFRLERMPGQPELAWNVVKRSRKYEKCEGVCVPDISKEKEALKGKESLPICAVNTIDGEEPPVFKYITSMLYKKHYRPIPRNGCDCVSGCMDPGKCSCAMKNGGQFPYNTNGAIVKPKPLVYECGPSCKCPPSCRNRISQYGIKLPLEIFKTESRGWGVRSLKSIPPGTFICEYLGKLLDTKEAEQRVGNDEYLFDIGHNYNDPTLWDELSNLMPDATNKAVEEDAVGVEEDAGFTIDAAEYGNVARFINHSCSPNLFAQSVLYDHEDKRMPHIMLFAPFIIPPLQELTYHYGYKIDQVYDSQGNIKKKNCYCGSPECTGRMY